MFLRKCLKPVFINSPFYITSFLGNLIHIFNVPKIERIVCFDIESGNKRFAITDPDMKTVYAMEHDPINQVLHVATGDNHDAEALGLTFDVSPINFGKLNQKWSHKTEVSTFI